MHNFNYIKSTEIENARFRCDVCGNYFDDYYYEMETENLCDKCFDTIVRDYYKKDVENLYNLDDFE